METLFRVALESDLEQIYEVFYENEIRNEPAPPPRGNLAELRHIFHTGTLYVAEQDGHICGYSGAITRSNVAFLTDLFVRPELQSSQLGKTLLQYALPMGEHIRCTISSNDERAQALYIRTGLRPQWPHYCLQIQGPLRDGPVNTDIEIIEGRGDDQEFVRWDEQISGRARPVDHAHWIYEERSVPLWLVRQGEVVGYAYVRLGAGSLWHPDACTIGPIGVKTGEDATAAVLAAVAWAQQHAHVLLIDIPGPHPCLATLLNVGFRILYVETFLSDARVPFFDAQRYIASNSTLL